MKLLPQEANELYQLRGNTTLVRYLQESLTEVQESLVTVEDERVLRILQGRGQTFKEILMYVRDGPRPTASGKR
jgi:hypothetical protein